MNDLIRRNKKNSIILLVLAFLVMLAVGYILGDLFYTFGPFARTADYEENRIWFSLGFAGFIGAIQLVRTYLIFNSKPKQLFNMLDLKEADTVKFAKLNNVIAEMSIAAGIPKPPKAYIIPSKSLNAMAFGIDPENGAIAITSGLLSICNRDELQGVVAHEISHLLNRDSLFLEVCRSTLGMVIILRDVLLRSIYVGARSGAGYRTSSSSSSKGKGSSAHLIFLALGIIFAILAPLIVQIIYFAISREREYLADAEAARLTRYPPGLASALSKIAYSTYSYNRVDKVTSAAFIDNPFGDAVITSKGSRTHPPIRKRIKILESMGGAGFVDYQKAYLDVMKHKAEFMPESMANSKFTVPLRHSESLADEPDFVTSEEDFKEVKSQVRSEDIVRLTEDYSFIQCECGMKIKVPPDYKGLDVKCPRCGRKHVLENKMKNALAAMIGETVQSGAAAGIIRELMEEEEQEPDYSKEEEQEYIRQGDGWEEIPCKCGAKVQLSPTFIGKFVRCRKCKRKINIV